MSTLGHRALEIVRRLAAMPEDHEDAEILCEGGVCYFGIEPLRRSTVNQMLRAMAVRIAWEEGRSTYYRLSDAGRSIARRPELADETLAAVMAGQPFQIVNDHIQFMSGREELLRRQLPADPA